MERSLPNFLDAVNSYAAREENHVVIKWDDLINAFPILRDEKKPAGEVKVTTSVHCECTVAVHMLRKLRERPLNRPVEIGIYKYSCWLCGKYLKYLSRGSLVQFVVSGFQGKIQPGWMPPSSPPSARNSMAELVEREVNEIIETTERKRRSDSFPTLGSPETSAEYQWTEDQPWLDGYYGIIYVAAYGPVVGVVIFTVRFRFCQQ